MASIEETALLKTGSKDIATHEFQIYDLYFLCSDGELYQYIPRENSEHRWTLLDSATKDIVMKNLTKREMGNTVMNATVQDTPKVLDTTSDVDTRTEDIFNLIRYIYTIRDTRVRDNSYGGIRNNMKSITETQRIDILCMFINNNVPRAELEFYLGFYRNV